MKKIYTLVLLLFFAISLRALTCNFNYAFNPGTTTANFSPDSSYLPSLYHFLWNFGDGTTDTLISPVHTYLSLPPYMVCCDIYDNSTNALVCSACDSVTPYPYSNCNFTFNIITGDTVQFMQTDTTPGVISQWNFGDSSNLVTGSMVTHVYTLPGVYNVCMTQSDSETGTVLCSHCQVVYVNLICSFTWSFGGWMPNSTTFFSATVTPGSTITWYFGDNTSVAGIWNQTGISHTYNSLGTYYVCIDVVDSNNDSCSFCDSVLVAGSPGCSFSYIPDSSNSNTMNFSGQLANPVSADSITWFFGDGYFGRGFNISHTYNLPGTYNVCMTETDSSGAVVCTSCNYVSPVTGIVDLNNQDKYFRLFPNPVISELHIRFVNGNNKFIKYRILSLQGTEINSGKLNESDGLINLQNLSSGSYLFELTMPDGFKNYKNIIKN